MPTADPIRCPYCVEDDNFILGQHSFDKEAYDAQNGTSSSRTDSPLSLGCTGLARKTYS
jgi:hypothetical protein